MSLAAPQATLAAPIAVKTFDITGSGSCARMRMGDLNGDGRLDFLMVQPTDDNPSYVQMLTAYDGYTGKRLWQVGSDNGLSSTDRDEPAQIYDIDNDGRAEVVAAMAGQLRFYNGADGTLKKSFDLPAGDAHDAVIFANFSKNPVPQDIVLKNRYQKAWVVDITGKTLWTYSGITGHYPWPYDTDGDGRDELFIGYSHINYDGKPLYPASYNSDHPDCIWIGNVTGERDAAQVLYGLAQNPSQQLVDARTGKVVWTNSDSRESQQVIMGDFRKDLPGQEIYGLDRVNRSNQDALFVISSSGKTLWQETPDNSGYGTAIKLVRNWDGTDSPLCLAIKRGGGIAPELRDGTGAIVARVGADGQNAVVGDFAGDRKQEIVMYSKTVATVYAVSELDYSLPVPSGRPLPQNKEYYNYSRYGSGDLNANSAMGGSRGSDGTGVVGTTPSSGSGGSPGSGGAGGDAGVVDAVSGRDGRNAGSDGSMDSAGPGGMKTGGRTTTGGAGGAGTGEGLAGAGGSSVDAVGKGGEGGVGDASATSGGRGSGGKRDVLGGATGGGAGTNGSGGQGGAPPRSRESEPVGSAAGVSGCTCSIVGRGGGDLPSWLTLMALFSSRLSRRRRPWRST